MNKVRILAKSLATQPSYTLMRVPARFPVARSAVSRIRSVLNRRRWGEYLREREARMHESAFLGLNAEEFVLRLKRDGVAFGLQIPSSMVSSIRRFAEESPCFADRDPRHGFMLSQRAQAESKLGKPILLAQYFNTVQKCAEIEKLKNDPLLEWIAGNYLGSLPAFVGANLWWTFPVKALEEDRFKHAHLYHRDIDCFRFFKFFFYITDVEPGDGAHVAVVGSHLTPPTIRFLDAFKARRYSDAEIAQFYDTNSIREICGNSGVGFAENTLCIHKGLTPTREPRLLLQLQFALFDYHVMHDERSEHSMQRIA